MIGLTNTSRSPITRVLGRFYRDVDQIDKKTKKQSHRATTSPPGHQILEPSRLPGVGGLWPTTTLSSELDSAEVTPHVLWNLSEKERWRLRLVATGLFLAVTFWDV